MGKRSIGFLIVATFVGILTGNIVGEVLNVIFGSLDLQDNVVQKVLVDPLVKYVFPPLTLNLIVMTLTFGFSLNFNVISLLGIGTAWYYVKYSY